MTTLVDSASVVDIFCGAGGLSYGFRNEGFEVVAGIDADEACRHAYEANIKAPFLRKDASSLKGADLKELFLYRTHSILVGCAPCQPFSTYNQKNEDPNWTLLRDFGRLITDSQPDIVSMENVPRLLNFREGAVFCEFTESLRSAGYEVVFDVLFGPDFGLAQTRSRLVLLASRKGTIDLPKPTHVNEHRTVEMEIGKLSALEAGSSDNKDRLHRASRLSPLNTKRIQASKPGGTWRDWPEDLVTACHRADTGRGYSSVYGRMRPDQPAPTITTQFYGFGNGRFGHPSQDRALSLREGAMLQGFPQDYEFVPDNEDVSFKNVGRMIGNAVPVPLASAIARAVRGHLAETANA
ncbi:MAG: DNA (cytosine-5-)-methyltransferase [Pseudomonadota bacterium]